MTSSKTDLGLGNNPRVLVARTDRIGDVVLSLPVFASLRAAFPGAYICALTREYTRELMEGRTDVNKVITFQSESSRVPYGAVWSLAEKIRAEKFDVAVALYLNFSTALTLALSGIPRRIGPATKLAQIFLTDKVTQRRAKSDRHEADHNLDLLKPLGVAPVREISIDIDNGRRTVLQRSDNRPLIGVHPGHGGSSRNWPEKKYIGLIDQLDSNGYDVVLTGSTSEKDKVEKMARHVSCKPQIYIGDKGLRELAGVISEVDLFVASSTGPLHLATAVDVPVVGLYCPITVCLPRRWGPLGENDITLAPDVEPCERCIDEKCPHYDCMDSINVKQVLEAVMDKVKPVVFVDR